MLKKYLPILFLVSACKYPPLSSLYDLASGTEDMAFLERPRDLRGTNPVDLRSPGLCRGTGAPGIAFKLVTNALTLPRSTGGMTYAFDYDGDGRTENQFKNLINVISLSGLDLQTNMDAAVAAGDENALVDFITTDPMNSACVGVVLNWAQPYPLGAEVPRFDGTDVFTPGPAGAAQLAGQLQTGALSTTLPPKQTAATEQTLNFPLNISGATLNLPLRGVHIQGNVTSNGGVFHIVNGSLHGVISKTDIDGVLIPAVANLLTQIIHNDTVMGIPGDTAKAIIGLFEQKGNPATMAKCMVPANCCAVSPATCLILPAEVQASSIGGVLAPDVQVFDGSDHWLPVPGGKDYNGMSFGMGFTAVTATY